MKPSKYLSVPCPTCASIIGEPCLSFSGPPFLHVRHFHAARRRKAFAAEPEWSGNPARRMKFNLSEKTKP